MKKREVYDLRYLLSIAVAPGLLLAFAGLGIMTIEHKLTLIQIVGILLLIAGVGWTASYGTWVITWYDHFTEEGD